MSRKWNLILIILPTLAFTAAAWQLRRLSLQLERYAGPPFGMPQPPPPPNRVVNIPGHVLMDEYMLLNMMYSIKPDMIAVWPSPDGKSRWAIRLLPTGNVTSEDVEVMMGMSAHRTVSPDGKMHNSLAGPSHEAIRAMLIDKQEEQARLAELARKYPLPDGWPEKAMLWKAVRDPVSKKVHLAPTDPVWPARFD